MQLFIFLFEFSPFIGRFHPLFVHLPIGFIVIAYLLELVGGFKNKAYLKASVPFVLWIGGISGIFAVVTGLLLADTGGYGEDSIFWHQWSGIVVTILVFTTLIIRKTKIYFTLFSCTIIAIFVTGHLGGNLTHGETYLTEHLPAELKNVFGIKEDIYFVEFVSYEEAKLYKHLVYPIFHDKCVSCHNNSKMKGELNMKNFDAFLKGGENGTVIEINNAKTSDLVKRIILSESHEDTMPPEGKERINKEELELIKLWINQDLKEDTLLDSLEISQDLKEDILFRLDTKEEELNPVFKLKIAEATEEKLEKLRSLGFNVLPLAQESPFLQVSYFDRTLPLTNDKKKALIEISKQLVWLDLSGVKTENDQWVFLESLPNLIKLHLSNTSIKNQTVIALSKNRNLETIGLFGTSVNKEILKPLMELEHLKSLYIGNTAVRDKDTISLGFTTNTNIVF